ncbi:MAG: radical SAM protein [Deltaproteobacteria bacterium]|nr:radical SAM protein [Deltaproteobacteria bacterium]
MRDSLPYEQGPIRPPSEAGSLLVRVNRNCPWNKCAFCPVYKGRKFSSRGVEEVLSDLDAMRRVYGSEVRFVFLQDANALLMRTGDLLKIVEGVRARFPAVERITAYARSRTLARKSLVELVSLRDAGLNRLHVGMESASDAVLKQQRKGTTGAEQIEAGQKAKAAGFELSEYVMPGLGGRAFSEEHADETARALVAIEPDFVRLRTTAVVPGTPLAALEAEGEFLPLGEMDMVAEIRRFLAGLAGASMRLESDHMLNLLMELKGDLPRDLAELLSICDRLLALPEDQRWRFVLARRMGWMGRLKDFEAGRLPVDLGRLWAQLEEQGLSPEEAAAQLRAQMV